ncbi:MAG: enoyl-CoA hydratase/isomerase family protein [Pseudomonadales bacterium]|nr:enoyl-CoA hydratase/isomerase family protein [Pseudomonadales bacterium]
MKYRSIRLEIDRHIALITLDRPDQLNTFNQLLADEWNHAYHLCENNDDIRAIVVAGSGKAFCAGADMSEGETTFDSREDMSFSSCPVIPAWRLSKPVIGAINGHAVGVGFGLALQFDFRFVADEAKYGLLQVRRGVLADACSHWLLPRMVGIERAMDIILTGKTMKGAEVAEIGLAKKSLPAAQVLPDALAFAEELVTFSAPAVLAITKQLVWQSLGMTIASFEKLETQVLHHTMGTADALEGGLAYMERRQALWQGSVNHDWPDILSKPLKD